MIGSSPASAHWGLSCERLDADHGFTNWCVAEQKFWLVAGVHMNLSEIDPVLLGKSMRFALDLVAAHRIAKGLTLDQERATAIRETLEERVILALTEVDLDQMPVNWSWQKAAETISVEIALQIIREQKHEPPDPAYSAR